MKGRETKVTFTVEKVGISLVAVIWMSELYSPKGIIVSALGFLERKYYMEDMSREDPFMESEAMVERLVSCRAHLDSISIQRYSVLHACFPSQFTTDYRLQTF